VNVSTRSPREVAVKQETIYIGEVFASREPTIVKTLLGSCIAVCLWDPGTRVGGMNHFLLPHAPNGGGDDPARFGVHAMDLLICEMLKAGADRHRLRAKIFGGAHVLSLPEDEDSVPSQNIAFAIDFVRNDGFKLTGEDLGGYQARRVHFQTDTGRAFVQRIASAASLSRITAAEQRHVERKPTYGAVELF